MANPPLISRWHRPICTAQKTTDIFSNRMEDWKISNWKFKNEKFESMDSVVLTANKSPAISQTFTHTKQKWPKLFHRQIYFYWLSTNDSNQRSAVTFLTGLLRKFYRNTRTGRVRDFHRVPISFWVSLGFSILVYPAERYTFVFESFPAMW